MVCEGAGDGVITVPFVCRVVSVTAIVPATVPVDGDLDFEELAGTWQLSGGYIRNAALRAAYLAAVEERPLSMNHLLRAVRLEYRDRAKLAEGGRLE